MPTPPANPFQRATRRQARARVAITGVTKSGKTWTALAIATALARAEDSRIAVLDTEHGRAELYGEDFDFDSLTLTSYNPRDYVRYMRAAEENGYRVAVIDSLSHAWSGKGGVQDLVEQAAQNSPKGDTFRAWGSVGTPAQRDLIEGILGFKGHLISTLRVKTEYVITTGANGKQKMEKVGLKPDQRDGLDYEFDVILNMDMDHTITVEGSRCPDLPVGATFPASTGPDHVAQILLAWLKHGQEPLPEPERLTATKAATLVLDSTDVAALTSLWQQSTHAGILDEKVQIADDEMTTLRALFTMQRRAIESKKAEPVAEDRPELVAEDRQPEPVG
jgi:hypothetical protein